MGKLYGLLETTEGIDPSYNISKLILIEYEEGDIGTLYEIVNIPRPDNIPILRKIPLRYPSLG